MSGWTGQWVSDRLGVTIDDDPKSATPLPDLIGLALRRNPRRAHLLVSTVLGKHVPTDPRVVFGAAARLGDLVADRLAGGPTIVIGYAETATGLGHVVADRLGAAYLHSTRRSVPGVVPFARFDEEHSHATRHLLLPDDHTLFARPRAVVLVDDEVSTGRTALNTIAALRDEFRCERYVIATLVDVRSAEDRGRMVADAQRLGVEIEVMALASGRATVPGDLGARVGALIADRGCDGPVRTSPGLPVTEVAGLSGWPRRVRDGARHGVSPDEGAAIRGAARACAADLAPRLRGDRVLVLAAEELMYAPLMMALALTDLVGPACVVRFSSTTRSPALAIDEPGYPIRTGLAFASHDGPSDGPGDRFAYNVAATAHAQPFTDIVVVVDDVGDTPQLRAQDGLLAALTATCRHLHLVVIPSFRPASVRPMPARALS